MVKSLEDIDPVYTCDRFARGKKGLDKFQPASRNRTSIVRSLFPRSGRNTESLIFLHSANIYHDSRTHTHECVRAIGLTREKEGRGERARMDKGTTKWLRFREFRGMYIVAGAVHSPRGNGMTHIKDASVPGDCTLGSSFSVM